MLIFTADWRAGASVAQRVLQTEQRALIVGLPILIGFILGERCVHVIGDARALMAWKAARAGGYIVASDYTIPASSGWGNHRWAFLFVEA